ncbi:MAG: plastocyanin/azurin family copper-binding protein [Nitrosopumilus sp.]
MLKKITIIGAIGITILVIIGISISYTDNDVEEIDLIITGDVVMPTKVSRPGCEKENKCYIPSVIVVEKGQEVTWINEDSAFHSVTSGFYDESTTLFDSGHLDPYESYTLTFDEIGTYDYFCTLHPWMKGQVIVE